MIISVDDRRGAGWPVPLVLAAVCGLLAIFGVAFLQQRALDAKIDDRQTRAEALARQVVVPATKGEALTKPLSHASSVRLLHDLEKGVLSNGDVLRVRVFAQDGTLLFSTDPNDKAGEHVGDADSIRAAAIGSATSSVATDGVAPPDGRSTPVEMLETYVQFPLGKDREPAAVGVDERYQPIETASEQPWHTVALGLEAAAAILAVAGLLLLARRVSVKRADAKARKPAVPKPAKDAAAAEPPAEEKRRSFRKEKSTTGPPPPSDAEKAVKEARREMQVREALEGQLEQLRTRIREQEDLANRQVLELTQQLQVAAARVDEAEARAASSPSGADAERLTAAEAAVQDAARRAEQAEARASAAEGRAVELEGRLADAHRSVQSPPIDERVAVLERALEDARAEATDQARRAEATEAVRAELETKVAQFGSRAQEQETTAAALAEQLRETEAIRADLERRASEAESGGDAIRSTVAQLSAERDALRARVEELEASAAPAASPPTGMEELEQLASARSELLDVRQQLGNAIERARVAEERATKLEADLLAERQGVRDLEEPPTFEEPPMFGDAPPFGDAPAPLDEAGSNPFPWLNGNGNGDGSGNGEEPAESLESAGDVDVDDPPQGDRSLRYRLAQSAARKKGLSDIEPSS
jgi:hypothetical protein